MLYRRGKGIDRTKRGLGWVTAAATVLIVLSIGALLVTSIVKIREDALAQARIQASYLSAALAEDLEGSLNTAAVASEFVKRRAGAKGDAVPLAELKQAITKYLPSLVNISVIGPDGGLRATSGDVASSPANFSQFAFFTANRDSMSGGFRVGEPVAGLIPGRIVIPETQRLESEDGAFAGVVLFLMDPERATALYRRVDLGSSGSLMVVGTGGTIFAGYSLPRGLNPSLFGTQFGDPKLIARLTADSSGSYVGASPIDGIDRIYSWRRLKDSPAIALVGLGKAEALAGANRQATLMSSFGVVAAGLLLTLIARLSREISRRIRQAITLDDHRRKLKVMNADLAAAKRQAEQANESKSRFLANIGHELRTPLNGIIGFSEIIRDKVFGHDLDRYAEYASHIYRSASHLLGLVQNLLDWKRIEASKFELHEGVLDLAEIESECLRVVRGQANNNGIALRGGSEERPILLYADKTALKQILLNILSNAIKYTPHGGTVWLERRFEADGSLTLAIRDSGIGMTPDEIQLALQPFQRVESALLNHREGTGLGLPLAAQLIELHGGSLTLESQPGQGTAVFVRFPASRLYLNGDPGGSKAAAQSREPRSETE
jgi:signal transduction histidine kinase